jgi:carboxylesterase type B
MASFVTSSPNVSETVSHHLASLQVSITGELDKEGQITNFRGIPYATVNERWTHSTVLNSLPDSFDATDFGPRCVQKSGAVLVTGGENDPTPGDDEFNCLNLNVTVPTEFLPGRAGGKKGLLPVMVWIHGYVSYSTFYDT